MSIPLRGANGTESLLGTYPQALYVNVHLPDRNAQSLLYSEFDILHNVVGYLANADTIFQNHIQVNDDLLVHNPDLDATAMVVTLQYLCQATVQRGTRQAHYAIAFQHRCCCQTSDGRG
jgi:hypothetical protein